MNTETNHIRVPAWRRLRSNLVLYAVLLAIIPVILVSYVNYGQTLAHDEETILDTLNLEANAKQDAIETWLASSNLQFDSFLASSSNYSYLVLSAIPKIPSDAPSNSVNRLLASAISFETNEAQLYTELFIYDETGRILFSSDINQVGKVVSRQPYFEPSLNGSYIQFPYYQVGSSDLTMMITRPLLSTEGRLVGVVVGRLNLETLSAIIERASIDRDTNETFLISRENNFLITPSRFPGYGFNRSYQDPAINAALNGEDGQEEYDDYRSVSVFGVYRWIPDLQAGLITKIDKTEALNETNEVLNTTIRLAGGVALIAALIGFFVATAVARPIIALTNMAVQVAQGNLDAHFDVRVHNEIGVLADTFNDMTSQLREFIISLEDRVNERTRDLQAVTDVNTQISTILEVDRLLQDVVDLTKERFGLYHAHIYLLDETNRTLTLTVGAGHVGRQMVAEVRTIDMTNQQSIVASAARSRRGVIINDVRKSATFLPHPLLPNTASELAVPLVSRNELMGVLDVQSDTPGYFTQDVLGVMELLAGQVASALSNASLYEAAERTSRYERAMGNIDRQIQGAADMDEILQITVRELGKALRVPHTAIELQIGGGNGASDDEPRN